MYKKYFFWAMIVFSFQQGFVEDVYAQSSQFDEQDFKSSRSSKEFEKFLNLLYYYTHSN
jgi:hypothetical protein